MILWKALLGALHINDILNKFKCNSSLYRVYYFRGCKYGSRRFISASITILPLQYMHTSWLIDKRPPVVKAPWFIVY